MKKIPAWLVLFTITLIAGLLLAVTNDLTKPVIAQQAIADAEKSRAAVLPEAEEFTLLTQPGDGSIDWCYEGKAAGQTVGYVAQATVSGFGGPIEIIVGVNSQGQITGINVGGSAFGETAGLGAKTKDADFRDQFAGKTTPLRVIKAGESAADDTVDAVTAATISSRAVTGGVNAVGEYLLAYIGG